MLLIFGLYVRYFLCFAQSDYLLNEQPPQVTEHGTDTPG